MIPAIHCSDLVKRYGELTAVDGLDLEVRPGECFGLLGPNGAGKTTTVEMLEGILRPDAGVIEVLGRRWERGTERALRCRLGIQLQETKLPEKLTVLEILRLFASFYDDGGNPESALRLVALEEKRDVWCRKLSGGQRQRLSLACALVARPELLFLDEPTTGLDPQSRLQIWDIVGDFRRRGGTVLMTTHYMEEAHRLCDRVAVVDQGKVIALGSPAELIASLEADQFIEFRVDGTVDLDGLRSLEGVRRLDEEDGAMRLAVTELHRVVPRLLADLQRQGRTLASLSTHQATLEDVFVSLTGRHLRDG